MKKQTNALISGHDFEYLRFLPLGFCLYIYYLLFTIRGHSFNQFSDFYFFPYSLHFHNEGASYDEYFPKKIHKKTECLTFCLQPSAKINALCMLVRGQKQGGARRQSTWGLWALTWKRSE